MIAKTKQEWIEITQTQKKILLFYKEKVLDVTKFVYQHPGGVKAVKNYVNKDVSKIFYNVFPHSDNDFETLMEYNCGIISNYKNLQEQQYKRSAFRLKATIQKTLNSNLKQDQLSNKQQKKVIFEPSCIQYQKPNKQQRKKRMIKILAKRHNNQIFDEDQNIDQQKPALILKFMVIKQPKF